MASDSLKNFRQDLDTYGTKNADDYNKRLQELLGAASASATSNNDSSSDSSKNDVSKNDKDSKIAALLAAPSASATEQNESSFSSSDNSGDKIFDDKFKVEKFGFDDDKKKKVSNSSISSSSKNVSRDVSAPEPPESQRQSKPNSSGFGLGLSIEQPTAQFKSALDKKIEVGSSSSSSDSEKSRKSSRLHSLEKQGSNEMFGKYKVDYSVSGDSSLRPSLSPEIIQKKPVGVNVPKLSLQQVGTQSPVTPPQRYTEQQPAPKRYLGAPKAAIPSLKNLSQLENQRGSIPELGSDSEPDSSVMESVMGGNENDILNDFFAANSVRESIMSQSVADQSDLGNDSDTQTVEMSLVQRDLEITPEILDLQLQKLQDIKDFNDNFDIAENLHEDIQNINIKLAAPESNRPSEAPRQSVQPPPPRPELAQASPQKLPEQSEQQPQPKSSSSSSSSSDSASKNEAKGDDSFSFEEYRRHVTRTLSVAPNQAAPAQTNAHVIVPPLQLNDLQQPPPQPVAQPKPAEKKSFFAKLCGCFGKQKSKDKNTNIN